MKQNKVKYMIVAIFAIFYIGLIYYANHGWNGYTITNTTGIEYEKAKVVQVISDNTVKDETIEGLKRGSMELLLQIKTGRYKGEQVKVSNYLSAMYNVDVKEGDHVAIRIDTIGDHQYQVSIYNYYRTPYLLIFIALFAIALIAIGGKQGLKAFLGLVFTFVSIIYILVPLTLKGYNSVLLTLGLVGITTIVSFYLLAGLQPKSIGGALGCICGVIMAAILGFIAIKLVHISAYQSDEAEALLLLTNENNIKLSGLFLSSVLLASLGAVMDIAMSVASAMEELKIKKNDITQKELFLSGLKVGRDASGTMANTLVLAIAGASFNMMILIYSYQVSFIQLMNTDFVTIELIRGIAGSLGIILAIPFVACITSKLLTKAQ